METACFRRHILNGDATPRFDELLVTESAGIFEHLLCRKRVDQGAAASV
jgi:hypothetical protein